MYTCCPSGMVDMEAETPCEAIDYIYLGMCDNARNHISILITKLSRLSKISRYL